ncbi:MAG TPA: hypothetical protein VFK57_21585 [Vicinamibacterales bacterium]|nr:hypothetical protein [Vicinamibacterales bacterium]
MIRPADPAAWREFKRRLPTGRDLYEVQLPADLPYQGTIAIPVEYVPSDGVLQALRGWMAAKNQTELLYFLTEGITGSEATSWFCCRV